MNLKLPIGFLVAAIISLAAPELSLACACCTDTGQRYVGSGKISAFQLEIIKELRFGKSAILFVGARDLSDTKGIANPSETYAFSASHQKDRLVLSFLDEKKNEGTLTLALPDAITIFEVDTRDPEYANQGLGPTLYKEWRLTAPFSGTGVFKAGNGGYQRITLVLQGRGRNCPDANQFTHWSISVHGPIGNYLFFGEFEKQ